MTLHLTRLPSGPWSLVAVPGAQRLEERHRGAPLPVAEDPLERPSLTRLSVAAPAVREAA